MNIVFWLIIIALLAGLWLCLCRLFPILGHKVTQVKETVKQNIESDGGKENGR